jgi:hypothetical protein
MDPAQRPESTSTNSARTRGDAARGALGRYLEALAGQPLAVRTRQAYAAQVSAYIAWLAERPDADGALREPRARDFAARDFKRHLKLERATPLADSVDHTVRWYREQQTSSSAQHREDSVPAAPAAAQPSR